MCANWKLDQLKTLCVESFEAQINKSIKNIYCTASQNVYFRQKRPSLSLKLCYKCRKAREKKNTKNIWGACGSCRQR